MLAKPMLAAKPYWREPIWNGSDFTVRAMMVRHQQRIASTGSTTKAAGKTNPKAMDVVAQLLEIVNMKSIASAAMALHAITIRAVIETALFDDHTGKVDAVAKDTATASTAIVKE